MKCIGLDTSVVIRLLTGAPQKQAEQALKYLQETVLEGNQALVSDLVIAEAYFALCYHYEVPKKEAASQLLDFLNSGFVKSEPKGSVVLALKESISEKQPVFVDRLIRRQYLSLASEIITFDVSLSRLENVKLLV